MRPPQAFGDREQIGRARRRRIITLSALLLLAVVGTVLPPGTAAEQVSDPTTAAAGGLDAGDNHSCALLTGAAMRCWSFGGGSTTEPARPAQTGGGAVYPLETEKARASRLRSCLRRAARHTRREIRRARHLSGSRRARAKRHLRRHRSRLRRACLKRHGRTPGRVTALEARAISRTKIVLTWGAPGTDGAKPPAARTYLVKQSSRQIRGARGFRRAQTLCKGRCRFPTVTSIGAKIMLTITNLRPNTTYYYAVAARDNVSHRPGRRSTAVKARTR